MIYKEIAKIIINEIIPRIENHNGLQIFAAERARFEPWLKVEFVDIFMNYFKMVLPEQDWIDIVLDKETYIELKTVVTNYSYENVKNKTRPITNQIDSVVADINKLQKLKNISKIVVVIVYPCTHNKLNWQEHHLKKISMQMKTYIYKDFKFKNGIPGVIYAGEI